VQDGVREERRGEMSRKQLETCIICDGATGRSGKGDDSLYCHICEKGPYCDACYYDNVIACQDDEIAKLNDTIETVMFDRDNQLEFNVELRKENAILLYEQKDYERTVKRLNTENAALREKMEKAMAVGHNDDCMFCGFKDKILGGK
jgi:hypothetical protein